MKLTNKAYDVLKQIALVWLPALATLYFALTKIWGFAAYGEEISGSLMAIDTFLGAVLKYSSVKYKRMEAEQNDNEE